jgi:hypothetical protein
VLHDAASLGAPARVATGDAGVTVALPAFGAAIYRAGG